MDGDPGRHGLARQTVIGERHFGEDLAGILVHMHRPIAERIAGTLWIEMVARHGLANVSYSAVSSWPFGDAVFGWSYDFFADGSKARRLGFHEHVDTAAMFFSVFDELRVREIIA